MSLDSRKNRPSRRGLPGLCGIARDELEGEYQ
jgi:hypothetical protein